MCAQFLPDYSFPPFLTSLRRGSANSHPSIPGTDRTVRKAASQDGLLARLVSRSTAALGSLVEEFQTSALLSTDESAREQREVAERMSLLRLTLRSAPTLDDYRQAASELDKLEGNDAWRDEIASHEYNYSLVQSRLLQLEDARVAGDITRMLFLIRTSLTRNLGGMGNLNLYKHSRVGTKRLIERYIASALETLRSLLELSLAQQDLHDPRHLLEQVIATRQAFGRSALLVSGGGTFGMNHIGVVKALWEAKLLPRIVSGSSAGSIVCAVLCTRTDEELPQVIEEFSYGDLAVFTGADEAEGVLPQIARFLKIGAMFDISNLTRVMKGLLGDMTFQEAYNRTRRILNICVSSASLFELPRLLNYVTAPNIIIWSAVAASCSVPLVFNSCPLLAKDPKTGYASPWNQSPQRFIDGSVDNDIPMTRLAEMFNVNHFIVSQVNPHVVPFLIKEQVGVIASDAAEPSAVPTAADGWFQKAAGLAREEAMHRLDILAEIGVLPNLLTKARSILSQRYSGHITIFPDISYTQFPKILQNPTNDFMEQAMLHGERATWPKLDRIQNHVAIELALDDAVQQLRTRIAFSPSQVDLRMTSMAGARPLSRPRGARRKRSSNGHVKRNKSTTFATAHASDPHHLRPASAESNTGAKLQHPFLVSPGSVPVHLQSKHLHKQSQLSQAFTLSRSVSSTAASSAGSHDDNALHQQSDDEGEGSYSTSDVDEYETDQQHNPRNPHNPQQSSQYRPSQHGHDRHDLYQHQQNGSASQMQTVSGLSTPNVSEYADYHLFPYASQPATPAHMRGTSGGFEHSSPSGYFYHHPAGAASAPKIPSLTPASLSMTPFTLGQTAQAVQPGQPDLVSPDLAVLTKAATAPASASAGAAPAAPGAPGPGPGPCQGPGLDLDISGTRGMLLRKKRSMSFGRSS